MKISPRKTNKCHVCHKEKQTTTNEKGNAVKVKLIPKKKKILISSSCLEVVEKIRIKENVFNNSLRESDLYICQNNKEKVLR